MGKGMRGCGSGCGLFGQVFLLEVAARVSFAAGAFSDHPL